MTIGQFRIMETVRKIGKYQITHALSGKRPYVLVMPVSEKIAEPVQMSEKLGIPISGQKLSKLVVHPKIIRRLTIDMVRFMFNTSQA